MCWTTRITSFSNLIRSLALKGCYISARERGRIRFWPRAKESPHGRKLHMKPANLQLEADAIKPWLLTAKTLASFASSTEKRCRTRFIDEDCAAGIIGLGCGSNETATGATVKGSACPRMAGYHGKLQKNNSHSWSIIFTSVLWSKNEISQCSQWKRPGQQAL